MRIIQTFMLTLFILHVTGCVSVPVKKSEWVGTYIYEENFINRDGSKILIQNYIISIEKEEDVYIARYKATGFENVESAKCTIRFGKKSIKLVFSEFENNKTKKNEVYTPGNILLKLEKKSSRFIGKYISDQQKQGTYIFKKHK